MVIAGKKYYMQPPGKWLTEINGEQHNERELCKAATSIIRS